jgi:hypothetical protein
MGYVKTAPIAYETAVNYTRDMPNITFAVESTESFAESYSQSMTDTRTNTWEVSGGLTVTAGVEAEAGVLFAKAKVTASASVSINAGYGGTTSTEIAKTVAQEKVNSTSRSMSFTVGEKGEPEGKYRFALFGTNDVYCLLEVNPNSYSIINAQVYNCARPDTTAWGIDYTSFDATFGKTGGGEKFKIPAVTYTAADEPSEVIGDGSEPEPPPPEPVTVTIYRQSFQDIPMGTVRWDVLQGNAHVDSGGSKWIQYEVRANFSVNPNRQSIHVKLFTIVTEIYGDYTCIQQTREFDVASENNETIESLTGQTAQTPNAGDYIVLFGGPGIHFDGNLTGVYKQLSADISLGNNNTLFWTSIRLDGPGSDADADGVDLKGDIRLQYKAYR